MNKSLLCLRYVDNRLWISEERVASLPGVRLFLSNHFYGGDILLEDEPAYDFVGFSLDIPARTIRYNRSCHFKDTNNDHNEHRRGLADALLRVLGDPDAHLVRLFLPRRKKQEYGNSKLTNLDEMSVINFAYTAETLCTALASFNMLPIDHLYDPGRCPPDEAKPKHGNSICMKKKKKQAKKQRKRRRYARLF
ncbi:hypothetical protein AK812_SmicGene42086 [Symbiodinium microadriaticum]|uniref:Uncharacterized protein n=1 Tax=Symbiodinium microadriaticum TaxID=2951 RepID=A0A1Q9C4G3_SYMMI|nr:hypothetical protein AK812_SmicGene42086 [Symbiodinium microadriaticum]